MDRILIERLGGIAGFGGLGGKLQSRGEVSLSSLCAEDQACVEKLFTLPSKKGARSGKTSTLRDEFYYKVSRTSKSGAETVEVPESALPAVLSRCVKDQLT
jgi:hypothetical protein